MAHVRTFVQRLVFVIIKVMHGNVWLSTASRSCAALCLVAATCGYRPLRGRVQHCVWLQQRGVNDRFAVVRGSAGVPAGAVFLAERNAITLRCYVTL